MRAILRTGFGGPEVLVIREIPEPEPKVGHAAIHVKALGLSINESSIFRSFLGPAPTADHLVPTSPGTVTM